MATETRWRQSVADIAKVCFLTLGPAKEVSATPKTGARALYETLRACGVTHLFGLDAPEALYAELDRAEIRPVTVRDERSGAIMADAFARITGRAATCTGLRGPGATNLVTGVAEAWASSIPVVAITSDVATSNVGRHQIQELDQHAVFSPITKWAVRLDLPQRVSELTSRAFAIATSGRPGPVLVSCPDDVLAAQGADSPGPAAKPARYPRYRSAPDPDCVREAAATLQEASRPAIVVGSGVLLSRAFAELRELAELVAAPVATTPLGKGAFDETHPLSLGVVSAYNSGRLGRGHGAAQVLGSADVVLLVGSKADSAATSEWTVPSPDQRIIRVDIDPVELCRNYPGSLAILGDAKLVLAALVSQLRHLGPARPMEPVASEVTRTRAEWLAATNSLRTSDARPIRPERVVAELDKVLNDRAILCADASYSSIWALDLIQLSEPGRRFLAPRGFAGIGWGLPAAIAAKLAAPDKQVVCLTGDGGFGYVFQELETAARYSVPVTVVVLNNHCFGYQKHWELAKYGKTFEADLLDVDHAALAKVLHCDGLRVTDARDVRPALMSALTSGRATVIDVVVDPDAYPPIGAFDSMRAHALTTSPAH